MRIIRGTTPTIIINIKNDIDLSQVVEAWVYFSQRDKVRIDKITSDITILPSEKKMQVTLTQEDTLNLKEGDALFQVRLLFSDGTALATKGSDVEVYQIYKGGEITDD